MAVWAMENGKSGTSLSPLGKLHMCSCWACSGFECFDVAKSWKYCGVELEWEEGVNQEIVYRLRLKFTNPQNCNLVVTNSMHPLTHKICFLSESERQFQRSTSRGEGEDATSPPRQHYSQAATARYLIMRKATKKSLKVSERVVGKEGL